MGFPLPASATTTTAVLVKDINPGASDSAPDNLANVNGTVFFAASDATNGSELWKSDGTAAGTTLVKDINPGAFGSTPQYLTNVNGTLFFTASDPTNGRELWKSDGTAAGTALVKDINPGASNSDPSYDLTSIDGILFFTAFDPTNGTELWKSDGTAAGTTLVKDMNLGASNSNSYPRFLTNVNGTLFFIANDATNGIELWKSDGTAAGTTLVKDINPGSFHSEPRNLTNFNGTLFFTASEPTNGIELWKSDGTAAGTTLVKDINPGASGSGPYYLTNVNGTLFFVAYESTSGYELWKSDGTAAGTALVKDINPGASNSEPADLTNVNGTLFFEAYESTNGSALWKSDGTASGTALVKDIRPGVGSSLLADFTDVNGTLFFETYESTSGYELWKSDGTASGTALVKDINPGSSGSSPSHLTNVNGTLFFAASDPTNGRELWKTTPANTAPTVDAGSDVSGSEGSAISLDATVTDADTGDTVTTAWSVPSTTPCSFADATAVDTTITCTDDGTYTATLTANDGVNADVTDSVTVTVTNAAAGINHIVNASDHTDDGVCNEAHCSLREAINATNALTGTNTITFEIGTGPQTITLGSSLPMITKPVVIDATTQDGFTGSPIVELTGPTMSEPALWLNNTTGSIVRGLVINGGFSHAILIQGGGQHRIETNFIGTDRSGSSAAATFSYSAITIQDSANNIVGGSTSGLRNLISSGFGVHISYALSVGNSVTGNYFGTTADGSAKVSVPSGFRAPATSVWISNDASANTITRNVLVSHTGNTVELGLVQNNVISGNLIGTDKTGTVPLSTGGVSISGSSNTLGGATAADGNVIGQRVALHNGATANVVKNNSIGTDVSGSADLNATDAPGIDIYGASSNVISDNLIKFNGVGIRVADAGTTYASRGNTLTRNSISNNANVGIDLGGEGVTANDAGDLDTGANRLQNFPVLASVASEASSTVAKGALDSAPSKTYRVEFFASPACDASGFGEGRDMLASTSLTTDASGRASFSQTLPFVALGNYVTATATDADGNTSEFSRCAVAAVPEPDADGDGVSDSTDNCPDHANPAQIDSDGDDIGDVCDPNAPPTVDAGVDVSGDEGSAISLNGDVNDPDIGDTVSTSWTVPSTTPCSFTAASSVDTSMTCTDDGIYTATLTASDGVNSDVTDTVTVTVANVGPTVTLDATNPLTVNESGSAERTYTYSITDPGTDAVSDVTTGCGANGTKVAASDSFTNASGSFKCLFPDGPATSTVSASATDSDGATGAADTQSVTIDNVGPTVTLDATNPLTVNESGSAERTYTYSITDPGTDAVSDVTTGCGANGTKVAASDSFTNASGSFKCLFPDGPATSTVSASATDSDGATGAAATQSVTIDNVAPVLTAITAPGADSLHALSTAIDLSASFTDAGANESHTCSIDWGYAADSSDVTAGDVAEPSSSAPGTCTASHTYAAAGLYTISVTVSDGNAGSNTETVGIVVYDPSGGFVTGSGSFESPLGAYTPDPDLTGRARFRFVSKYQKGATAPIGDTGFEFQAAGLSFESESYAWLVVSGPKAQFKGSGMVNGATGYGFLLTANDGQVTGGGGVDKFRIKIWDKTTGVVVYDNQPGEGDDANAATAITGGQIMVQKK